MESKTAKSEPSGFKFNGQDLVDCSHDDLVRAVKAAIDERNDAQRKEKALLDLLRSPFPIHALWKGFAEWFAICVFALAVLHAVCK